MTHAFYAGMGGFVLKQRATEGRACLANGGEEHQAASEISAAAYPDIDTMPLVETSPEAPGEGLQLYPREIQT